MVSPPPPEPAENRTKENKRKMRIHATAKNRKIKKVKYKKFEPLRRIEPTPRKTIGILRKIKNGARPRYPLNQPDLFDQ